MDPSEQGQQTLINIIEQRLCTENIDRVDKMGESNSCEGFWGLTIKFTKGKRLNLDQADTWKSILELCFCRAGGNVEKSMVELSKELGLEVNSIEQKAQEKKERKGRQMVRGMLERMPRGDGSRQRYSNVYYKERKMPRHATHQTRYP